MSNVLKVSHQEAIRGLHQKGFFLPRRAYSTSPQTVNHRGSSPVTLLKNDRASGQVRILIRDDKYSENTIRHCWDIR